MCEQSKIEKPLRQSSPVQLTSKVPASKPMVAPVPKKPIVSGTGADLTKSFEVIFSKIDLVGSISQA